MDTAIYSPVLHRFSRWAESIPIHDMTAETVAKALVHHWISRYWTPSTVSTDRGRQFESHLFRKLTFLLGSTRPRTTACHPAANGIIERFHRQLNASLKAQEDPNNWYEYLLIVLLGIRTTVKEDIGCTPAELVYGTTLTITRTNGDVYFSYINAWCNQLHSSPTPVHVEHCPC